MDNLIDLLKKLVSFKSITPYDAGCQDFMRDFLQDLGFKCKVLNNSRVSNFFAYIGETRPLLVFAGHTDVVATGDPNNWHNKDPFSLNIQQDILYGRGVADMKGALAVMLIALRDFLTRNQNFKGSLGILITSGEEGEDYLQGTPYVMQWLKENNITIDYCIVGEPTAHTKTGDVIKIGRRGSLNACIKLEGIQGHVAYPKHALNPIHQIAAPLYDLTQKQWDKGNEYFLPTSMQITKIHADGFGSNVTPKDLQLNLNFRYSPQNSSDNLKAEVANIFTNHDLTPEITWTLSGEPFLTSAKTLVNCAIEVIENITGFTPISSTDGGTSDARFIAPYKVEVIEIGVVNKTIHQINECVKVSDLEVLRDIYLGVMNKLLL